MREEKKEAEGKSVREITAKKKVVETGEKRMRQKKKVHLGGSSSWAAFQQTGRKNVKFPLLCFKRGFATEACWLRVSMFLQRCDHL